MYRLNNKKGFTLLELLVVIAIIGILSGVVLTFLSSARAGAKDARIKSAVKDIKNIIEINYDGIYYQSLGASVSGSYGSGTGLWPAPTTNPGVAEIMKLRTELVGLKSDYNYRGNVPVANARATSYAIYAKLASDPSKYFCMDSTGRINQKADRNDVFPCP